MEFKRSIKKREIFYLIEAFLIDNGLKKSAECFHCEAELSNEYTVCDNISLETIVIEFEIFYYQRFKAHPHLCKMISPHVPVTKANRSCNESKKVILKKCTTEPIVSHLESLNTSQKYDTTADSKSKVSADEDLTIWKEYQDVILQTINPGRINIQWQDIKGTNEVKELLKEAIIYPLKYPHVFTGAVEPWKSILMYGPPGTGKTSLAHAAATESSATFFNISSSLIVNKWRGDTEKLIRVLFELADKKAPSIIIIDEIDALALKRNIHEHEASRRMKSELFFGIDKLIRSNNNVLLLATTNTPWDLDEAMLRRFEKHVYVAPPDEETRKSLFQFFLPRIISTNPIIQVNFDYDFMTEATEKYTGRDIKNLCKDIKLTIVREVFSSLELNCAKSNTSLLKKEIPRNNLENILSKFKPIFKHSENMYLKWPNEYY